jgi:neutral ceramidase
MLEVADLRFSAEWPGQMMNAVEEHLDAPCLFMQGALGDLTVKKTDETRSIEGFGRALAEQVVEVATAIQVPGSRPTVVAMPRGGLRVHHPHSVEQPVGPVVVQRFVFPELVAATITEDMGKNVIRPRLTVVLINRQLALVGGSGEWFSQHSVRLKERSRDVRTFVFGCCNGHHMYFPTIEATAEGGYGADPMVSWVGLGAGEQMMDRALIHIYTMLGKYEFKLPF